MKSVDRWCVSYVELAELCSKNQARSLSDSSLLSSRHCTQSAPEYNYQQKPEAGKVCRQIGTDHNQAH